MFITKITRRFYSSINNLIVSPALSHVCSKVDITGNGFEPNTPLTIQSKLVCPEEGFDYQSYAHIYTNGEGWFDLKTTESMGGTYRGVDQMGLFWSMVTLNESYTKRSNFKDGLRKIVYDFNIYKNHIDKFSSTGSNIDSSGKCTRYLAENVIKKPVKHGNVRGTLFLPENGKIIHRPAVIVIKGGLKKRGYLQEDQAVLLANEGFVTLNLAYFGVDDLPNSYTEKPIRIEYFEEAMEFLRKLDEVDPEKIYALGISKGGDISLAMMTHLPQIKKVCWLNGNISNSSVSSTYKGDTTDELSCDFSRIKMIDEITYDCFDYLSHPLNEPKSIHNFQRSEANLLMIAGLKDRIMNSKRMVDVAKKRMDSFGKTNYRVLQFPELGHFVDVPNMPVCVFDAHQLIEKGKRIYYGGADNPMASAQQQLEAWESIVNFFNEQ